MPSAKRIIGPPEGTDSPSTKRSRHEGRRDSKELKREKEKNEKNDSREKEHQRGVSAREVDRRRSKDDEREKRDSKEQRKEVKDSREHRKDSKESKDSSDSRDDHRDSKKERERKDANKSDAEGKELIGPPLPEPKKEKPNTDLEKEHKKVSAVTRTTSKDEKLADTEKDHKKVSTLTRVSSKDESESKSSSENRRGISDANQTRKSSLETKKSDSSTTSKTSDSKPQSNEKKAEKVVEEPKKGSSGVKVTSETKNSTTEPSRSTKIESESKKSEPPKVTKTESESKKTAIEASNTSKSTPDSKKETTQSTNSSKATSDPKKPIVSSNATTAIKKQIEAPRLSKPSAESRRAVIEGPKASGNEVKKIDSTSASALIRRQIAPARKPVNELFLKKPVVERKLKTVEEFYAADDEAAKRIGSEALLSTFMNDSAQLKTMIKESLGKNEGKLPIPLLPVFANLRRTMRLMMFHNRQMKEGVAGTLKAVEHKFLGFQNAKSEIQHLQKDIARCLEFRSADEDIDLDSVEEFYENAPESISKPETTKDNEHELHIARLNWEMQQRVELAETLVELEGRRDALLSAIKGKEKRLKSMDPQLQKVSKAFLPIREICGNWPGGSRTDDGSSSAPKMENDSLEEVMET